MKRCKDCLKASACRRKSLPFVIAIPFSLFAAILTWIAMTVIGVSEGLALGIAGFAFILGGGAILAYVELCVARHCNDDSRRERRVVV